MDSACKCPKCMNKFEVPLEGFTVNFPISSPLYEFNGIYCPYCYMQNVLKNTPLLKSHAYDGSSSSKADFKLN